jgi:tetratricopeptide (TPR) repeat protein
VGDLGTLDFSIQQDGRSIGRFKEGGVCGFAPDATIVTGSFEGSVFVGTAVLCQIGQSCEKTKASPVLAVWHDDALVASIKLGANCTSPALSDHRLVFSMATGVPKTKSLDLKELYKAASEKLASGDFVAAREQFQRVLAQDDPTYALGARIGLGVAQVNLKDYGPAIENLEKATSLAQRLKALDIASDASFNLSCAQAQLGRKREAIAAARQAVTWGKPGQYIDSLEHDPDLESLRDDDEFRKLVTQAKSHRRAGK